MKDRNENRPGYKKTKVGWIPEEWEMATLAEIIKEKRLGANYVNDEREKGLPLIKMGNIGRGKVKLDKIERLPSSLVYEKKYLLQKGDILFNTRNTLDLVGKVAIWDDELPTALYNSNLLRIKFRNSRIISPAFANYLLNFQKSLRQLRAMAIGTTSVAAIYDRDLTQLIVALPSLLEQNRISEILSAWDKALEQIRKLIEAKKHRKKGLMQQLLTGKRRLKPYAKPNRKNSYRFFDLPEDWACPQIKDIARECSERNTGKNDLPVMACSKHLGFVESSEYFGKRVFSEDTSNYKAIRRGQFGFPSNHIEEGSIGLLQKQDIGLVSPIYIVFKCNENIIPEYLFAVFKTDTYRHIFKVSTNASVDRRGSLRWREFSLIYIPMPTREEQKAIANGLQTSDEEIVQLEEKLQALKKQKRGLMQKLLTGEVRVKL